jgi:hypothetical protein
LKSGAGVVVVMLMVPVAGTEVLNHPVAANIAETLASTSNTTIIVTIIDFFIFLTCPFIFCHVRKRLTFHYTFHACPQSLHFSSPQPKAPEMFEPPHLGHLPNIQTCKA